MSAIRSRRILHLATLLIALASLSARAATAQEPGASGPQLGRLGPSATVRAILADGRTLSGRFVVVGDGRLGVRADAGNTDTLRLAELRTLSLRGRHTRTGALVGGGLGLAAGLFFGYMIGAVCDADECDRGEPFLLTIPLFTGGGTLLGAAVGSAVPRWTRVYP